MAIPSLTSEERALLDSFQRHNVRFLIVGLTSAVMQGAHVVTQDIDLWIENLGNEKFVSAVKEVGAFYIPPAITGSNPPMLGPSPYRIFDLVTHMDGLADFESEYEKSETVTLSGLSLQILPLERIIVSKEAANREKDKAVLPILKATVAIKKQK